MIDDSAIEDMRIIEFVRRWLPYGGGTTGDLLIEFVRRWLPYGGGTTGDLLVEFGMTPACYIARLNSILAGPTANQLDPNFRDDLRRFVSLRTSRPAPTA